LGFECSKKAGHNILYTILSVTSFAINYNKTHKSRLEYEIKYDPYKTAQKISLKN